MPQQCSFRRQSTKSLTARTYLQPTKLSTKTGWDYRDLHNQLRRGPALKHLDCLALVLCASLLTVPALAKDKVTKLTFDYAGQSRTYYAVVPDVSGPLPVVVLLHGSGRNGQIMADAWKDLASKEHFIVAAPDAYDSLGWGSEMDPPEFLHAVVDQVKAIH